MRKFLGWFVAALGFAAVGSASAVQQIPGQLIFYSNQRDAMTDANNSRVYIAEMNDTGANTLVGIYCNGNGDYDIILDTKNPLMTESQFYLDRTPKVMYRIDSEAPKTVVTEGATLDDEPDLTAVWFTDTSEKEIYKAFVRGRSKVTMRILREGMSPLDYTFTAKGFIAAMNKVGNCQ